MLVARGAPHDDDDADYVDGPRQISLRDMDPFMMIRSPGDGDDYPQVTWWQPLAVVY